MNEPNLKIPLSSDELWLKIINEGKENRVEVNQRMLIDKMLARYSSEFVVYRELIQNSDDAQSTSFTLEITCDLSTATINYETINKDDLSVNQRRKNYILEGIGQLFKNHWKPNTMNSTNDDSLNNQQSYENDFNNCIITEIRTINNGNIFNEDDWKRVITIAEGDTNVDAIGQFGVGFFSVFSYSERPIIQSGKHCLAFSWQNGKSLTTFRKELSHEQQSSLTSIILKMKNKYILETKSILDINEINIFQVNKIKVPLTSTKLSLVAKRLNSNNIHNQILKDLIPLKFHNLEILPAGQIFIGLATHQTTGIGIHLFSHLIPTIERENIDLQDLYISIGKIIRYIYDQRILDAVNNIQQDSIQHLNLILSPYAFEPSVPNKEIGKNNFSKALKERRWIEEIDNETIIGKIHQSIFLFDEFIELLHWLCKHDINNNKPDVKHILSKIQYHETHQSPVITLENITYYDFLNISSLPLPPSVLSSNIVGHISREDLQRRLLLLPISTKILMQYYLDEKQLHLFQ
ncbi:unnamed protein product [Rotaria sp. Silwood2]|nr:unnamed protein product [Rotaria sp. Silwood2]